MLGEMLIELKQAQHALVELEAVMKKEPNRFRTYYHAARAASMTGDSQGLAVLQAARGHVPEGGREPQGTRRSQAG